MKERRGTVGRMTGLAEGVAAAVRRRQQDREPRIVVYDRAGHPRVIPSEAPGHADMVATVGRLIELAMPPRRGGAEPEAGGGEGAAGTGGEGAAGTGGERPAGTGGERPAGSDGGPGAGPGAGPG